MSPDIQKAVESGKLTSKQGSALAQLEPGSYVLHKSWGFGRVAALDFLVNSIAIDFGTRKAHPMLLNYAADSLQPIAKDHILAQKAADLDGVRARAKDDPITFTRLLLEGYGGRMTQDQVANVLTPDVFAETEFKRWWEGTKKLLKTDGHFSVPGKKADALELRDVPVSRVDELLTASINARQLKDQIAALDQINKNLELFTDPATQLGPIITSAEETARRNSKLNTAESLQLLFAVDEIAERAPGAVRNPISPTVEKIYRDEERRLSELLSELPAVKLKRALTSLPNAFGEAWVAKALSLVTRGSARVVGEAARLLQEHGKTEELRGGLDRAIRDHSITTAALIWFCDKKERKGAFRDLVRPRALSAILTALERDQFNESRDRKLQDLLLNDKDLIPDLVADAEPEEMREITRKLLVTPAFEELNKRSILGRIVKIYPDMQQMITGDPDEKQEALIVSWSSLEKRKEEYEELANKKIPQNTQEISIAREHGDLRENFEFKAAKEMQRVLMRRKAETERELSLARGTDFKNPDITQVSIGTTVTFRDIETDVAEIYHILGAWDSNPDENIISYKAAISQAIMGRRVKERVEIPTETGERTVEIVTIVAWLKK